MVQQYHAPQQHLCIADRLCDVAPQYQKKQDAIRIAETGGELEAAYRLVYQEYLKRGFCLADPSELHYSLYCLLPQSRTFILERDKKILGTLSLIVDSPCGLPIESEFAQELQQLRPQCWRIAELSLLALDTALYQSEETNLGNFRKLVAAFSLFKGMFDYVRIIQITDLVIAVHPNQETLYESLTFRKIAEERPYRPALKNPAIAMHMNIQRWFDTVSPNQSMKSYFLRNGSLHP